MSDSQAPLLETINSPADLRELSNEQLAQLAQELREFLIDTVSRTGGHLSAGLGTVELTLALHTVFNTPEDRLVWDVGHQTYPHKIITGRREAMASLRQKDGLSGFPKRSESEYDTFGVGHSSTSISAALGMAIAAQKEGRDRKAVAIIGDGAMTAGMAFEALNHAGDLDANLLVVLNDNDMSISTNVGGLSNYLAKVMSGKFYSGLREGSKKVLGVMPPVWELAQRVEEHMKGMVVPGTLFEELGFNYIGPIDGHDLPTLITTLKNMRNLKGPQFLHVVTTKGKGYEPAEQDPTGYHGISPPGGKASEELSYTQVFGKWLCNAAQRDDKMVAITPAMIEGSGMVTFAQHFPDRCYDVGIAEQHAVTLAAGMACDGLKPVLAIYSTFLQRGYDQLIHDVAIQNLPVVFAIDRAGVVGPDGSTHAGSFDLSFLRCIPNMIIMAPSDEAETWRMLNTGLGFNGPSAIRYPRDTGTGKALPMDDSTLEIGKAEVVREGQDIALLSFGSLLPEVKAAAEELNATVVNMRFIKPLDEALLLELSNSHRLMVTIEDNAVAGGAGSAVDQFLAQMDNPPCLLNLGLPDVFMDQATRKQLLQQCGLDANGIVKAVADWRQNSQTCAFSLKDVKSH